MDRLRYLLGIVTLVVMFAGGWYLFDQLKAEDLEELHQVEVTFLNARGLKPGADVKYRGIQVGSVRRVDIEDDGSRAVALMTIAKDKKKLVCINSQFWIVTPRFHGLSSGVSGLETLVRDSYVAFETPRPFGEELANGGKLQGVEAPLRSRQDVTLPNVERSDLLMRVLLPENHGVQVGARVMFRGMPTGEVRSIELAPSGTHVEARIRVLARFRATVTDASVFWVSQPQLSFKFSLSNPVSVNELGSVLSPYIAYYTPPKTGVPVHDDYPVAASMKRPDIEVTDVPRSALLQKVDHTPPKRTGPVSLVRVIYEAIDVDYLSPNDTVRREGTGFLYIDKKGRAVVATTRSVCDAAFFYTETFGERAKIKSEKFAVQLPGNSALKASRIWVHPEELDIAVLAVQDLPRDYPTTKASSVDFVDPQTLEKSKLTLHATGERGVPGEPAVLDLKTTKLAETRGGALFDGDRLVALLGQESEAETAKIVTLIALPDTLRPGR